MTNTLSATVPNVIVNSITLTGLTASTYNIQSITANTWQTVGSLNISANTIFVSTGWTGTVVDPFGTGTSFTVVNGIITGVV